MSVNKAFPVLLLLFLFSVLGGTAAALYFLFAKKEAGRIQFVNPEPRTITHIINASGYLAIKDSLKIGALVAGTVQKIYVKENQEVKKGELLATIDNGKADTDVREAQGRLIAAQAMYAYKKRFLERRQELFVKKLISAEEYERAVEESETARGEELSAKALLDKRTIEYNNIHIRAPDDGVIISIGVTEGIKITTDLDATVLFEFARSVDAVEAVVDIDEGDISHLGIKKKVSMVTESYPYSVLKGSIEWIGYSPRMKNNIPCYQATIELSTVDKSLRPGMTVHARIKAAKSRHGITITGQPFHIDQTLLEKVAKEDGYTLHTYAREEKKRFAKEHKNAHIRYVWVLRNKTDIYEHPIVIGLTDELSFAVEKGLSVSDKIVHYIERKK